MTDLKKHALDTGVPIIKDGTLKFLSDLILENNYLNILELGTAIGYSSIEMAKLNPLIHIDTIEKDKDRYNEAIINIKEAGLIDQISAYNMDIKDFKCTHDYELIFVDAAKGHYKEYLESFIEHLLPWGTMVFDNMSFHGIVDDPSLTHNRHTKSLTKKLREFREYVQDDARFDIMLLEDTGDGILKVRRKRF